MSASTPQFLGYDLRHPAETFVAARWPAEVRRHFLLDPAIAWPRSVDTWVWPSLFGAPGPAAAAAMPPPWDRGLPFDPADFRQSMWGLWSDPVAMASAAGDSATVAVAIAIAVLAPDDDERGDGWQALDSLPPPVPADPEAWPRLGYDVADPGMISGLMNCGYGEEREALVAAWAARLNAAGLFDSLDDALAFRALTDARVPEHAPFAVFELRVAAEPGQSPSAA